MASPNFVQDSPQNEHSISRNRSPLFSPVKSPSPQVEVHRGGNLTGTARKLKDTAADVHSLNLKWLKWNGEGAHVLSQITDVRLGAIGSKSDNEEMVVPQDDLSSKLEPLCQTLENICQELEKITAKLGHFASMIRSLGELEQYRTSRGDTCSGSVIFQTWTLAQFEETFQALHMLYEKEVDLKRKILENICHTEERNTMMVYMAAWLYEPYAGHASSLLRESILVETGHKHP